MLELLKGETVKTHIALQKIGWPFSQSDIYARLSRMTHPSRRSAFLGRTLDFETEPLESLVAQRDIAGVAHVILWQGARENEEAQRERWAFIALNTFDLAISSLRTLYGASALRMGKIVRERYPELSAEDQEAVRQHAVAALNVTQRAKQYAGAGEAGGERANLGLIQGVRKFAMDVTELDIDLIDRINPFDAAYAVLAKAMDEKTLRQVQASIEGKRVNIPIEEARELAARALRFKQERGRLPDITSQDAWEKKMAEGVAALARYRAAQQAASSGGS